MSRIQPIATKVAKVQHEIIDISSNSNKKTTQVVKQAVKEFRVKRNKKSNLFTECKKNNSTLITNRKNKLFTIKNIYETYTYYLFKNINNASLKLDPKHIKMLKENNFATNIDNVKTKFKLDNIVVSKYKISEYCVYPGVFILSCLLYQVFDAKKDFIDRLIKRQKYTFSTIFVLCCLENTKSNDYSIDNILKRENIYNILMNNKIKDVTEYLFTIISVLQFIDRTSYCLAIYVLISAFLPGVEINKAIYTSFLGVLEVCNLLIAMESRGKYKFIFNIKPTECLQMEEYFNNVVKIGEVGGGDYIYYDNNNVMKLPFFNKGLDKKDVLRGIPNPKYVYNNDLIDVNLYKIISVPLNNFINDYKKMVDNNNEEFNKCVDELYNQKLPQIFVKFLKRCLNNIRFYITDYDKYGTFLISKADKKKYLSNVVNKKIDDMLNNYLTKNKLEKNFYSDDLYKKAIKISSLLQNSISSTKGYLGTADNLDNFVIINLSKQYTFDIKLLDNDIITTKDIETYFNTYLDMFTDSNVTDDFIRNIPFVRKVVAVANKLCRKYFKYSQILKLQKIQRYAWKLMCKTRIKNINKFDDYTRVRINFYKTYKNYIDSYSPQFMYEKVRKLANSVYQVNVKNNDAKLLVRRSKKYNKMAKIIESKADIIKDDLKKNKLTDDKPVDKTDNIDDKGGSNDLNITKYYSEKCKLLVDTFNAEKIKLIEDIKKFKESIKNEDITCSNYHIKYNETPVGELQNYYANLLNSSACIKDNFESFAVNNIYKCDLTKENIISEGGINRVVIKITNLFRYDGFTPTPTDLNLINNDRVKFNSNIYNNLNSITSKTIPVLLLFLASGAYGTLDEYFAKEFKNIKNYNDLFNYNVIDNNFTYSLKKFENLYSLQNLEIYLPPFALRYLPLAPIKLISYIALLSNKISEKGCMDYNKYCNIQAHNLLCFYKLFKNLKNEEEEDEESRFIDSSKTISKIQNRKNLFKVYLDAVYDYDQNKIEKQRQLYYNNLSTNLLNKINKISNKETFNQNKYALTIIKYKSALFFPEFKYDLNNNNNKLTLVINNNKFNNINLDKIDETMMHDLGIGGMGNVPAYPPDYAMVMEFSRLYLMMVYFIRIRYCQQKRSRLKNAKVDNRYKPIFDEYSEKMYAKLMAIELYYYDKVYGIMRKNCTLFLKKIFKMQIPYYKILSLISIKPVLSNPFKLYNSVSNILQVFDIYLRSLCYKKEISTANGKFMYNRINHNYAQFYVKYYPRVLENSYGNIVDDRTFNFITVMLLLSGNKDNSRLLPCKDDSRVLYLLQSLNMRGRFNSKYYLKFIEGVMEKPHKYRYILNSAIVDSTCAKILANWENISFAKNDKCVMVIKQLYNFLNEQIKSNKMLMGYETIENIKNVIRERERDNCSRYYKSKEYVNKYSKYDFAKVIKINRYSVEDFVKNMVGNNDLAKFIYYGVGFFITLLGNDLSYNNFILRSLIIAAKLLNIGKNKITNLLDMILSYNKMINYDDDIEVIYKNDYGIKYQVKFYDRNNKYNWSNDVIEILMLMTMTVKIAYAVGDLPNYFDLAYSDIYKYNIDKCFIVNGVSVNYVNIYYNLYSVFGVNHSLRINFAYHFGYYLLIDDIQENIYIAECFSKLLEPMSKKEYINMEITQVDKINIYKQINNDITMEQMVEIGKNIKKDNSYAFINSLNKLIRGKKYYNEDYYKYIVSNITGVDREKIIRNLRKEYKFVKLARILEIAMTVESYSAYLFNKVYTKLPNNMKYEFLCNNDMVCVNTINNRSKNEVKNNNNVIDPVNIVYKLKIY